MHARNSARSAHRRDHRLAGGVQSVADADARALPRLAPGGLSTGHAAFAAVGYAVCLNGELKAGVEKIVLYVKEDRPTHAARQLPDGWWTSKLGQEADIEHDTPETVGGGIYGEPNVFLSRRT